MAQIDYEAYWASYRSRGPYDWRGIHHGEPDPEFALLCAGAERRDMQIELDVSEDAYGPHGHEFRRITAICITYGQKLTVLQIGIGGNTLSFAAAKAREALGQV